MVSTTSLLAQSNVGELRLKVADPSGSAVKSAVELVCEANQFRKVFMTDDGGDVEAKRLPFGVYRVEVVQPGFAPFHDAVEVRSAIPREFRITLTMAAVNTSVTVKDTETLVDPHRTGSITALVRRPLRTGPQRCRAAPWWSSSIRNQAGSTKGMPCCTRAARSIKRSSSSMAFP